MMELGSLGLTKHMHSSTHKLMLCFMFHMLMPTCSCHVPYSMYLCLSPHASIMFQVCGSNVHGSSKQGQVDRVEQPSYAGRGPHMGLGLRSYLHPISYQARYIHALGVRSMTPL